MYTPRRALMYIMDIPPGKMYNSPIAHVQTPDPDRERNATMNFRNIHANRYSMATFRRKLKECLDTKAPTVIGDEHHARGLLIPLGLSRWEGPGPARATIARARRQAKQVLAEIAEDGD